MSQQLRSSSSSSRGQKDSDQRRKRTKTPWKGSTGFTCPGCEYHFPNIKSREQLIRLHMEQEETCKRFVIHCPGRSCEQKFISSRGLEQHFKYSPGCKLASSQMAKVHSFSSTVAAIPNLSQLSSSPATFSTADIANTSSSGRQTPKTSTRKRKSKSNEVVHSSGTRPQSPSDLLSFSTEFVDETTISRKNQNLIFEYTDSFVRRTPLPTASRKDRHHEKRRSSKVPASRSKPHCPVQDPSSSRATVSSVSHTTKREWDLALQGYNSASDSDYTSVYSSFESEGEEGEEGDEGDSEGSIVVDIEEEFLEDPINMSNGGNNDDDLSTASTDRFIIIQEAEEAERGLVVDDVELKIGIDLL